MRVPHPSLPLAKGGSKLSLYANAPRSAANTLPGGPFKPAVGLSGISIPDSTACHPERSEVATFRSNNEGAPSFAAVGEGG